jgi:hypothetical protein
MATDGLIEMNSFVLSLEAKAWKRRGKTFIQRTRVEWARYYAEKREMEDAEAIYWYQYEEAERRGDFDDVRASDTDGEPLDPEIMAIVEAMENEVSA